MTQDVAASGMNITENEIRFHCPSCGRDGREVWELPLDLKEVLRRMETLSKCKACGAGTSIGWPQDDRNDDQPQEQEQA